MRVVDKKGEMTIPIIIAVVIGVILLIFLLSGFSSQGRSFRDVIANLGGGSANVDTVMTGCEIACEGDSSHSYCEQERRVDYGDKTWEKGSCSTLEDKSTKITISPCDIDCGEYTVPALESSEAAE